MSINCATIHQEINKVYYSYVTVFLSKSFHMKSKTGITNLCLLTSLKKSFTIAQIKNDCTSKTRTESFTTFFHSTFSGILKLKFEHIMVMIFLISGTDEGDFLFIFYIKL